VVGIHAVVTKEAYDIGDMPKRMQIAGHKGFVNPRERIIIRGGYLAGPIPRAGHLGRPAQPRRFELPHLTSDNTDRFWNLAICLRDL
jgi:hypothetical protein